MFTTQGIREERLSKEDILKLISEEEIFRKYIDYDFKLGEMFLSPLRKEDNPSFNVYFNRDLRRIVYKDYSDTCGSCITFVMNKFNLTFKQALNKISNDFNLRTFNVVSKEKEKQIEHKEKLIEEKVKFEFLRKDFSNSELNFWQQYGITHEILLKYNVISIQKLYKNGYLFWTSSEYQPIFLYLFPRTGNMKIYRPYGGKFSKWRSNANNDWDIQGYDQLPKKGNLIIFTKSMKDCMTLYSLGYNSVSTHAEGNYINPDFVRHIKGRFTNIISLYDRDRTGMRGAKYLWKKHEIIPYFIPKWSKCKDISDFYQIFGRDETLNLIKNEFRI